MSNTGRRHSVVDDGILSSSSVGGGVACAAPCTFRSDGSWFASLTIFGEASIAALLGQPRGPWPSSSVERLPLAHPSVTGLHSELPADPDEAVITTWPFGLPCMLPKLMGVLRPLLGQGSTTRAHAA